MPEPKPFDIHDYIQIGLRRKWYIIVPVVISILVSFGVYKYLPKVYRATTLILVQSQKIPESYVRPTVTESVNERLSTISQEILSRTRLEKVIEEFNLFSEIRTKVPMEEIVGMMRGMVGVKVEWSRDRAQNTFTISYEGKEPRAVMMVTNRLASMFIEENLRVREQMAEGTSNFLSKELQSIDDQLRKKEHDIREYKERNIGRLPQQLDTNLRMLERLQQQLQTTSENIRATEDRIVLLENQMNQLKQPTSMRRSEAEVGADSGSNTGGLASRRGSENELIAEWNNLKRDLATAQSKYTDNHPDVIALKKKLSRLEPRMKELLENQEVLAEAKSGNRKERTTTKDFDSFMQDPNTQRLIAQYRERYDNAVLELNRSKEEAKKLKEQIAVYQKGIEETPKREQELILLTRDYDLMKANYQSLQEKRIQAQMAENLERKRQGEQFKILDPARLPEKPFKPDRNKILLIGAMMGLMAGLGLTWFRESLDRSFHSVSDVEVYLAIPVIATIPNLKEEQNLSAKRRAHSAKR
jgi:polysaccharide chain length determinant protein (PEP-CTERM system associated)